MQPEFLVGARVNTGRGSRNVLLGLLCWISGGVPLWWGRPEASRSGFAGLDEAGPVDLVVADLGDAGREKLVTAGDDAHPSTSWLGGTVFG